MEDESLSYIITVFEGCVYIQKRNWNRDGIEETIFQLMDVDKDIEDLARVGCDRLNMFLEKDIINGKWKGNS